MNAFVNVEHIIQQGLSDTAPAVALAVYYRGQLVIERAYGYIDPETKQRPTLNDTLFDLASVTKLFTSTAFLMQASEGKIALDDRAVSIVPEFGRYGLRPMEGGQNPHTLERLPAESDTSQTVDPAQITFRHLLTHTAGLAPWRDLYASVGPTPPPPGIQDLVTRRERVAKALDLIARYPFVDVPGHAVRYSDLGIILLGEAAARLDNAESVSDVIQQRVLAPLHLTNIIYNPVNDDNQPPEKCAPTEFDMRWRRRRCQGEVHDENACALGGIAGHAGLFGIAREVARFGLEWLQTLKGRKNLWTLPEGLAGEAVREHARTGLERRGLGWALKSDEGSSAGTVFSPDSFGHTGFTGTSLWIDPQRELVAAVLTNRVYHGRDASQIIAFRSRIHDAICRWVDAL